MGKSEKIHHPWSRKRCSQRYPERITEQRGCLKPKFWITNVHSVEKGGGRIASNSKSVKPPIVPANPLDKQSLPLNATIVSGALNASIKIDRMDILK